MRQNGSSNRRLIERITERDSCNCSAGFLIYGAVLGLVQLRGCLGQVQSWMTYLVAGVVRCRRYRLQDNALPDSDTVAALQLASGDENDPELRADVFANIVLARSVGALRLADNKTPLPHSLMGV